MVSVKTEPLKGYITNRESVELGALVPKLGRLHVYGKSGHQSDRLRQKRHLAGTLPLGSFEMYHTYYD